ncbi:MAG: hypothetical protein M0Q12_09115 [Synergistaceae bacterium]|nr:hypothetical protein [Synergistaceae bacterium]
MLEKNTDRISIRVPSRWKSELARRKIKIAPYVRSVIFRLLETSDQVLANRPQTKSKQQAAKLYNQLNEFFVRTKSSNFDQKMVETPFKTPIFRAEYLPKAQPEELIQLAEFLGQEEFAEQILQDIYGGL